MDETKIRYYIMVSWIIGFCTMWFLFSRLLPQDQLLSELSTIKTLIQNENWQDAESHMKRLMKTVEDKKIVIQSNNSTEAHSNFEVLIGQLNASIQSKEDDSLEYLEGLKEITTDLTKAFAGP